MIFKEETLSSEYAYKGRILNERKDEVTVINGRSTREIVEHIGGVAIAAVNSEGKIAMVEQFRKPFEDVILEVPAGKFNTPDEDHLEAAKRELREETGFTAGKWTFLTAMKPSVGYTTEELYIYLAEDLTAGETDFDDNEAIDDIMMDLDEAHKMAVSGKITDGKTLVAILLAKEYLRNQP